jgi:hypothetical protein
MNNELSIIVVNYNTKEFLKNCLKSVFQKMKDIRFEIWVIDNASTDGSLEMLREEFPKVKIITNKENIGFARANNQAIKKARGRYVFLLNPDTIILDENFKMLIQFMEEHPEAGACGPLVLNKDGTMQRQCKRGLTTFWNSFTYYSGLWRLFPKNKWWRKNFGGYFLLDKPDDKICEIDNLSGAAMMVRKETIEKVGLMCEDYIMYWDDVDWCFRIKKAGWKIYYVPFTKMIHYGGAGGAQLHAFKNLWYFHRGACLFYKRYLAPKYFFLVNFPYYSGVWLAFGLKLLFNLFRKEKIIGSKKP